jgi:hypothetical protein
MLIQQLPTPRACDDHLLWSSRRRYEKFDKPMGKRRETRGDDPFSDELEALQAQVADLVKVSLRWLMVTHAWLHGCTLWNKKLLFAFFVCLSPVQNKTT